MTRQVQDTQQALARRHAAEVADLTGEQRALRGAARPCWSLAPSAPVCIMRSCAITPTVETKEQKRPRTRPMSQPGRESTGIIVKLPPLSPLLRPLPQYCPLEHTSSACQAGGERQGDG